MIVDARGQMRPMPVLTLTRIARDAQPGTVIAIIVTDKGARADIPAWCARTGNEFLGLEEQGAELTCYVRKSA